MKLKAFLQAAFIIGFLLLSWILLLNKLTSKDPKPENQTSESSSSNEAAASENSDPKITTESTPTSKSIEPPDGWSEWLAFLGNQDSPHSMREALAALKSSLSDLSDEETTSRILAYLASGHDFKTGLAFQTGRNHQLIGLPSLRSFLIDLLFQINPEVAFTFSRTQLETFSTNLPQAEFALNLRNCAAFEGLPFHERKALLSPFTQEMINNQNYLANPSSAFAEAFDVIVFLNQTDLVNKLSALLSNEQEYAVKKAANLSLDRLIIENSQDSLSDMLTNLANLNDFPNARAGFFARADPQNREERAILEVYLNHPSVSKSEIVFFLNSFPNLNLTFSHSLLTENQSFSADFVRQRIQSAHAIVVEWIENPLYDDFYNDLLATRDRLAEIITTN